MNSEKKTSTWLSILILVGLGISAGPHQVLPRTNEVSRALSPVLSSYELIRMEPGEIERQVRTTGELRLRFKETDFYFNLEPHSMRAPGYRAVETGPGGVKRILPPKPVHTFKGVLAGREDTLGRFNLTDSGVEGVVYAPEGLYYVEPLRNYLPDALPGELVVYRDADIKPGEDFKCGVSLAKRLQRGVNHVQARANRATPTNYVVDVATEADYEYVQALGGSEKANLEIEGILNQVDGAYQNELLLHLQISFQHTWATEDDPYTARNAHDLLDQFTEYWNTHHAAKEDYDVAHLWTDRNREDGFIAGLANIAVACSDRTLSYGLTQKQYRNTAPQKYVLPAHEIGHNFGAIHPDDLIPLIEACRKTIMVSHNYGNIGSDAVQLTFCQFSRQQIAEYVAGNRNCLTTQPISLQPPTDLSTAVASESRVTIAWQDNSTNETGFIVQRRRLGLGVWDQIGTTPRNVEAFSDVGLFPESTYIYRVRAFNDTESSAFSNEAAATTLAGSITGGGWRIDTIAGRMGNVGDNGPANHAVLSRPGGVAVDGSGNVYIADSGNHRVRRMDSEGTITTIAGTGESSDSGDGGPAVQAQLFLPTALTVDNSGNLYIADTWNHRIRRVDATGTITTVAGTGERGYSGDGGPAVEARLNSPWAVTVDNSGNLYIADTWNHRVRRVDAAGTITTVAGTGREGYNGTDAPAVDVNLYQPLGLALDADGSLLISDSGHHRILRMDAKGTITAIAGTGNRGYSGDNGPAVEARLTWPRALAVDGSGNLYIADANNYRIRRMDATGTITTIAGTGELGYSGDNGPAVEARLHYADGLAVDSSGNVYIADSGSHRIRRIDSEGTIRTVAGIGRKDGGYSGDGGPAVDAELNNPSGVAVDGSGNLYISDSGNHRIRRIDSDGIITTIAGTGEIVRVNEQIVDGEEGGYSGDGGLAVHAGLNHPSGMAVDVSGNLYIADSWNHRIRRLDSKGIITTVAGSGKVGSGKGGGLFIGDGGPAVAAELSHPHGVAVDGSGNVYIADTSNNRIRRINLEGIITTIAGTGERSDRGDGGPAVEAGLGGPNAVALDGLGNLYIADSGNERIRLVNATGTISTVAGTGLFRLSRGEGPAVEADLRDPSDLAITDAGNLFIAERLGNLIRLVNTRGTITTIAGTGAGGYSGDGGPAIEANMWEPSGVVVDGSGDVYIADNYNHRIRTLTRPPQAPTRLTATALSSSRIKLNWQDNSTNETGFGIERGVSGTRDWAEIGNVAADVATFLDEGLKPFTIYHYRVRAFKNNVLSSFSNEATSRTPQVMPVTLAGFAPKSGPVGTRVTLTGTNLFEATLIEFNGVSTGEFEFVSSTSIEAVVPPEATSGPIRVVAPGGTSTSTEPFTVTTGIHSRLFVPIVLRTQGRIPESFFTSELTLTNRGSTNAALLYTYTAAFGGGSGTAVDSLEPGRQRVVPDAMAYLTSLGVPIGSGSAGGTLAVDFSNLSSPSDAAVTVRVATPVEEGRGRAGLAYMGLNTDSLLTGPVFITGLRQNSQDRSNVAVQNAGVTGEESITLRVTVFSGDPAAPESLMLPDRTLPPGGFYQYNEILNEAGFDNGYVRVDRVEGTAPFYAYGVINDNFNSDGSFVFPVIESSLKGTRGQTLPVIIETGDFATELTVTNFSPVSKTVDFRFVSDAVETDDDAARFSLELEAGEQRIVPSVVDNLRRKGVAGIGPADRPYVGALFATVAEEDMNGIVMGARTGAPDGSGGQYGLFYGGVPYGSASTGGAWIYGLQQNAENRSNLALVNTGEVDDSNSTFEIDIYDGEGDSPPRTKSVTLGPQRWYQFNGILGARSRGFVQVRQTRGNNPFVTYGVINDGGRPGQRSGDGAFVSSR